MVKIRQIEVRHTKTLEEYRQFDGPHCCTEDLTRLGPEAVRALGHRKVWMLNSTAYGGGVAEMMPPLCALLSEAGVDARWLTLEPDDPKFFRATKAIHNMLHGEPGGMPMSEIAPIYDQTSREAAVALRAFVNHDDLLIVHDPQPAGLARYLPPDHLPRLLWRSHIGVSERNPLVSEVWRLLEPYLEPYERLFFTDESYIPDELFARSGVMLPSIDPLSHKNRALRPYKLIGIQRSMALVTGPEPPSWAHFKAQAQRFVDGEWVSRPIDDLLFIPLITQISRFDRLKGFEYLIPAFAHMITVAPELMPHMRVDTARALSEAERVQLILAGPDPVGVSDDPEAEGVLNRLCSLHSKLPDAIRKRIHIVRLPMVSVRENALAVNALQRQSSVIVQNSLHEGFGLTVTEALWKGTPVVASNVGGIAVQIRNTVDGLLIHDPTDICALAEMMLRALAYRKEAYRMARHARERVRDHFLVTSQVRRWLEEITDLLSLPHPIERAAPLVRPRPAPQLAPTV